MELRIIMLEQLILSIIDARPVLAPAVLLTAVLLKPPVTGIEPNNEPKILDNPKLISSCLRQLHSSFHGLFSLKLL